MHELKDRIGTLAMTTYGLSLNGFEKKCGMPETTLNKMGEGLSIKNLAKIIKNCPEIDIYYLITGEFKRDNPLYKEYDYGDSIESSVAKEADILNLREAVESANVQIGELRNRVEALTNALLNNLGKK